MFLNGLGGVLYLQKKRYFINVGGLEKKRRTLSFNWFYIRSLSLIYCLYISLGEGREGM